MPRRQINFRATEEEQAQAEEAKRLGQHKSVTEVFRKALAIYVILRRHIAKGGKMILRNRRGKDETLMLP